jgi:L-ascorbate metabolism protein UlaG (beta-lactamase superfamily)
MRWLRWVAGGVGLGAVGALATSRWKLREVREAMGAAPTGTLAERVAASPHFHDGRFHNEDVRFEPSTRSAAGTAHELLFGKQERRPSQPIPIVRALPTPSSEGLFLTWYGHSNALLEIDGAMVLIDPVWSDRVSPSQSVGPKRLHPNPVELADLPPIDAVVISHDHYDHLDTATIKSLADAHPEAVFVVPLGVGGHLRAWGVPEDRIEDLDWTEDAKVEDVRFTATQAQHFSGRGLSRDGTLWASWVIEGPQHRVFYSGDGGYFAGFGLIEERYGPFDLSLVQIGAYDGGWPTIHMTPEQGVETHLDVKAELLVPVHWATFNLAFHAWSEPIERLLVAAQRHEIALAVPRPGERVDVSAPPPVEPWWRF